MVAQDPSVHPEMAWAWAEEWVQVPVPVKAQVVCVSNFVEFQMIYVQKSLLSYNNFL